MVSIFFLIGAYAVFTSVKITFSSTYSDGEPAGYSPDCPGSEKPAIITKKSLRHLTLTVQVGDDVILAKKTRYNYFQMKQLAKDPGLDMSKRTLVYVGGYLDSPNYPFAMLLAAQYKELRFNVLMLDTNRFTTMEYPVASRFMRAVGKHAAEMLASLVEEGVDPKKIEMVGLSLGGQTISFIAKNFRLQTGYNISRLTALDPAGPCFRNLGPDERLDKSDADFVEVVDTNIDGFGMAAPVGHVNFYPNGGEFQPGEFMWVPCTVLCSHIRSFTLWLAALQHPYSFIGLQCDSVHDARHKNCYDRTPRVTNILGLRVDQKKPGIYYLATLNTFPFYMGEDGLRKENEFIDRVNRNLNKESLIKV